MIGQIDSTASMGITHLIDRQNEFFQQHGGVVTQIHFDTLEEMTLDQFITDVVPTLKERKESMTIIKDPVRNCMYRILGDNVAIFHITDIKDVFFDHFVDRMLSDRPIEVKLNLTYPLIYYATQKNGDKKICVHIPAKQYTYHTAGGKVAPFVVWHPPMWFGVRLNAANLPQSVYIGVVLDKVLDYKDQRLYHMPLPNCYRSGEICFGGTHLTNTNKDVNVTESMAIELTYQRLFNSEFNIDLVTPHDLDEMNNMIAAMPKHEEITKDLNNSGCSEVSRHAKRIKYVFGDQANIWKFHYMDLCDGAQFLERL